MTALTVESIKTFSDLCVFSGPGGIEIARTEEHMQELTRRLTSAKAWGVPDELITPEQVQEKVPFSTCPDVGVPKTSWWSTQTLKPQFFSALIVS